MSKLLVVLGATGNQGGSVVSAVLNDPKLSQTYKIRAVTRDPSKPAAQSLQQKGVDVVTGDANDVESLKKAFSGAYAIFGVTAPPFNAEAKKIELANGHAIADAAVAAGAEYLIFSNLPPASVISGGKYTGVGHFDAKAQIKEYILSLPIKAIFYSPGAFMQNFNHHMVPRPAGDGTYKLSHVVSPQTQLPLIDIVADTGKYVSAILSNPSAYVGQTLAASQRLYTLEEIVNTISKVQGKTVKYNQLPQEVFAKFLPPGAGDAIIQMMQYFQDFGYWGQNTKLDIEAGAKHVNGSLTTFEEYLSAHPVPLQ